MLHVPGHADDHLVFVAGDAAFTGDAVLGEGSVFIAPDGGCSAGTWTGCGACARSASRACAPATAPWSTDPAAKLDEYIAHRLERERRLLAALEAGARDEDELLDAAWDGRPAGAAAAGALTLRAHLEKLREEGCRL